MNKEFGVIGNRAKLNQKTAMASIELLENNQNIKRSQDSMLYSSHIYEPFRDNNVGTTARSVDLENK